MPQPRTCPSCGGEMPEGALHCASCQATVPAAAPAEDPGPTAPGANSPSPASSLTRTETGSLASSSPTLASPASEQVGDRIGRYKLLQQIGEGGCGIVYMAEQQEPVKRRVALKVIKPGMDTRQVLGRFEAERQALALMEHPHIAKVLDAGATELGRPFFVMELVRGIKITDYCDQNNLSTEQRLALFVQICQAVQHAHQKGIIHRDIKPSNILVTLQEDGTPAPKIIDFGIAKASAGQTLTDKTVFTAFEQFIGTPAYTSPEQAEMMAVDIDTRSDIYSLGVLLYELLTGRTPFDSRRLIEAGLEGIRRIIREEEPPRPSTRITTLSPDEQTAVAKRRHAEPPKLVHQVRGDLDWIVMKCLEKDRTRRYETANGLARDIERHLSNEPVVACPPTRFYRLRKAIRRNKLAFAGAAVIAAVLVLGLAATTWQTARARRAEREQSLLRAEADKARLLEVQARQQAESARAEEAKARKQAEANAEEARRLLRRTYLANANSHSAHGDLAGSFCWLVEALKLARNEGREERAIRINIQATLAQLPELDGAAFLETGGDTNRDSTLYEVGYSLGRGSVALSPDCRFVGVCKAMTSPYRGGDDHGEIVTHIYVCDTATGARRRGPLFAKGFCDRLRFSPDSGLLLADTSEGVCIWEVATGEQVASVLNRDEKLPFRWTGCNDFSQDGLRALLVGQSGALIWDRASKESSLKVSFKEGPTSYAKWSPKARFVLRQRGDDNHPGEIQFWDLVQGISFSLPAPKAPIHSAVFSPDEKSLVCFYHDYRTYDIIDLERGQPLQRPMVDGALGGFSDGLAFFSPDGSEALLSLGGWSRRFSTTSWKPLFAQPHLSSPLIAGVFRQDSRQFAAVTESLGMEIWDTSTCSPLGSILSGPAPSVNAQAVDLRFRPEGQLLAVATPTAVWFWSPRSGNVPACSLTNGISLLQFSPDGSRLLVATDLSPFGLNRYQLQSILDSTGQRQATAIPAGPRFNSAAFSADGARVLLEEKSAGPPVPGAKMNSGKGVTSVPCDQSVLNLLAAGDGDLVGTNIEVAFPWGGGGGGGGMEVSLHAPGFSHLGDVKFITRLQRDHPKVAGPIKFFRQDASGSVPDESRPMLELNDSLGLPTFCSVSFDSHLLLMQRSDFSVWIYDLTETNRVADRLPYSEALAAAAFSDDSRWLATVCQDGAFSVWDLRTASLRASLRWTNQANMDSDLAFSKDARFVIVRCSPYEMGPKGEKRISGDNAFIRQIYDLRDGYPAFVASETTPSHRGTKRSAVLGSWNGLDDNSARVIDTTTHQPITPPLTHDAKVNKTALSADGWFAATASEDKTARVWDAETGEPVTPPLVHASPLTAISFSPDASLLATGTRDGFVSLWSLRPVTDSASDLQLLAELYAGRRVEPAVGLVQMTTNQLRGTFEAWRRIHSSSLR